jgi:integrase
VHALKRYPCPNTVCGNQESNPYRFRRVLNPSSETFSGHVEPSSLKKQHRKALRLAGVRPFVLYSLRHTFLTRLGESGCEAWTLARIAGHGSVAISSRLCSSFGGCGPFGHVAARWAPNWAHTADLEHSETVSKPSLSA